MHSWFDEVMTMAMLTVRNLPDGVHRALRARASRRGHSMEAEVRDLREGLEMVEERARWELGMVKPDEILVQVTPKC